MMGCTLCPSSMYTITFERLLHVNKVGVVIRSIMLRKKRGGEKIVRSFFYSSAFASSSSHLYFLPPALALATLSKDSLIGVLLTNTVK